MPYIVKSSLDLSGKIIPWNEQATQKMIEDKKEYFAKKEKEERENKKEKEKEEAKKENEQNNEQLNKKNKKEQKVGEK